MSLRGGTTKQSQTFGIATIALGDLAMTNI